MASDPNSELSRFKLDSKLERGKYARKREDHGIIYRHLTRDCTKHEHEFNYCKAAYKEVMTLAKNAGFLAEADAILGDLDGLANPFRSLPPPGKKIEFSVAKAIVPGISPDKMQRLMMDENYLWFKSMFPIITRRNSGVHCYFDHLRTRDPSIWHVLRMRAVMQLPSASAPTRYFEFMRYRKMIEPLLYIIVDFPSGEIALHHSCAMRNSKRKPSGVIIRFRADTGEPEGCEVIWIENMEVDETGENNMYSSIINSNLAFGAQRCINTLLHNLKRDKSKFADSIIPVAPTAGFFLLAYTEAMKRFFMDCVGQHPYGQTLTVKSSAEDPIRILHNKTRKEDMTFVGVASFRVQAKPLSVFQFLMKKDIDLEARYYTPAYSESETDEEIHKRSEQTDEVHEESEQINGKVHEEPEQTDEEVHERLEQIDEISEHTNEVHEESEQTDEEVHEKPEQTDEEVHERPEQTDEEVHERPEQIEVDEGPEQTHEIHEESEQTDGKVYKVHERSEQIDEVHEDPDQTDGEVHEESEQTDGEVHEESEQTDRKVHEKPEQTDEVYEGPEQIDEVHQIPDQTDEEIDEGLEQIDEVHERPEQTDEFHEGFDQIDGKVHEESEHTDGKVNGESEQTDEVHEKSDQTDEEVKKTDEEVDEGLEQIDEVHKEPEQTDEFLEGLDQTDGEVHEESEQTDGKVHEKPEQTDEVYEGPQQIDEVHQIPDQTDEEIDEGLQQIDEVHERPEQTDEFHEGFDQIDGKVHEESEHTDGKVNGESEQTDEVHEKPDQTDEDVKTDEEVDEGLEQIDEVHQEPEQTGEFLEGLDQTYGEVHKESEKTDGKVHEEPEQNEEVYEGPEQIEEVYERPKQVYERPKQIDGEVYEKPKQTYEEFQKTDEVHEEPEKIDDKIDENHEKPKLVVTCVTDDKSNIISLHRMKLNELANAYILQEASMDEHCSFILSKILTEQMVDRHIISGMKSKDDLQAIKKDSMTPIGFAIMPDGRGGLDCDACLITFLTQLYYEPNSNDYSVELVRRDFVTELNDVIQGLNENVVVEERKMTEYF